MILPTSVDVILSWPGVFWITGRKLRYAFSWTNFVKKIAKKTFKKNISPKNISKKKFQKIFREFVFQIFFGYRGPTQNVGCLGPLVLKEIDPAQTVVNPILKFIYRLHFGEIIPLPRQAWQALLLHDDKKV
jgi:hypothetical protein